MANDACSKGILIGFCVTYLCPDACRRKRRCVDAMESCPLVCEKLPADRKKCMEGT